ncbi:uncharacterized protein FTOL_01579 [Fusarium torulosum]|uniref:Uncharacterized protein n=1 Tax=Fusarium torulosum TaxID=33205 RepID=A0AAE8SDV7_9HYPO|nr:uncharacterized protein FTOL_01579 [Fusarium torulosum]
MFWNTEDLEDPYLRTPTKEVITKIASLESTSSGEQKTTTNCYVKQKKALHLMEEKTEKQKSNMVENEKTMLSTNKNNVPSSSPSHPALVRSAYVPRFHGDNLIAF